MDRRVFLLIHYLFYCLVICRSEENVRKNLTKLPYKLNHIPDSEIVYPSLVNVNLYAFATVPRKFVFIAQSSIPKAGLGVFAARPISRFSYFGPYGGKKYPNDAFDGPTDYAWEIPDHTGAIKIWVDAADLNTSNWLRFINCPNTLSQQNLLAFVRDEDIYYLVVRNISVGEELFVYYGKAYAAKLGIDTSQFP